VRNIEVISPRLRVKAGGVVGCDTVAKSAVGALEVAGAADLLRKLFVAPAAVDENAHLSASRIGPVIY
jgi:hypothetical protein